MRVIRYLFLLLSAVVMTGLFASQAHAATVQKDNETPDLPTSSSLQSSKFEEFVTQSESTTTVETNSQTKVSSSNTVDPNIGNAEISINSTTSDPSDHVIGDDNTNVSTVAGISENETSSNITTNKLPYSVVKNTTQFSRYSTTPSSDFAQTSQNVTDISAPMPVSPVQIPSSNNGLELLSNILKPVFIATSVFSLLSLPHPNSAATNLEFSQIIAGMIIMVGLLSALQMSMRKQGYSGAARSAGLKLDRLFLINKRELMSDKPVCSSLFSSLNFGCKTNKYLLIGGKI